MSVDEKAKQEFTFRDATLEILPGVFLPNRTTELLLEAALKHQLQGKSALDLGCGSGVVGLCIKKFGGAGEVCGSDISEKAVGNARMNAERLNVKADYRRGSLFEPWKERRFDVILNDVSGVAEPIARLSPWYPPEIFCDAGIDGSAWTTQVLESARDHLTPNGVLFFPTVSLSNEVKILEVARSKFPRVECLQKKSWPFKEDFWKQITSSEVCRRLIDEGIVKVFQKGSRYLWDTSIYMACVSP